MTLTLRSVAAHDGINRIVGSLTVVVLCILTGCHRPVARARTQPAVLHNSATSTVQTFVPGTSREGRPIECYRIGHGTDVILIMAGIHGNEPAGPPLVRRLAEYLRANPDLLAGRQVVVIPVANPDGLKSKSRYNNNGVDLNRNLATGNFKPSRRHGPEPLSEPESRAIQSVLDENRPHRVVTIHQPVACIDYDGPAESLARTMAEWVDLPVKRIGGRPGSLGSYVGAELGIPIVTLELPSSATRLDDATLWQIYGTCLLAAIAYPEPITADSL